EREFGLNLISTAPSCRFRISDEKGEETEVANPSSLPPTHKINQISEPMVELSIHVPGEFIGNVIKLCTSRRGIQKEIKYITPERVHLIYDFPLGEMVFDFYDRLKGSTKGYASLDYEFSNYQVSNLVKLDILLNGEKVDALSLICHRDSAQAKGRALARRLQKIIERQQFDVAIQAAVGAKILARETVKALRKNVLAKCYGGDITRKRKLLEKQKAGKKRMKMVGSVEIPQEAFHAVLKMDDE
ncbi:MAG: elongation factor 4, partial [Halobacteriovoraceae bacterium]|nr:elongation factor 4 [Halobacteriovoraceae bacterium]